MESPSETPEGLGLYGYRAFGRFRHVLEVQREGIVHRRGTLVPWAELAGFRAFPCFYGDLVFAAIRAPQPRLTLYLRDGRIIRVRGDLLRPASDGRHGARLVTTVPREYLDLVALIQRQGVPMWAGPREEFVLLFTAFGLGMLGFLAGLGFSYFSGQSGGLVGAIPWSVVGALLFGNGAFVVAPSVARAMRKAYLATWAPETKTTMTHDAEAPSRVD